MALVNGFFSHIREPLYRNGYALVLSSAASSGLGMVYWILATHRYTTDAIGINSAMISAMSFLANLSQLNLMNALNRFLPSSGRFAMRMVSYFYLISLVCAVLSSLIFIFGVNNWAVELGFLGSSPAFILWFTAATMSWCIYILQDSSLIGLRQATWVPVKNLLFAVLKIGLLIFFAGISPHYGVFASWTVAVAIAILPAGLLIFKYLLPRHELEAGNRSEPIRASQIIKFVTGDYLGSLISQAAITFLPFMIIARVGASGNAYFYLSSTIAYALTLITRNMGMSLIAESAVDPSKFRQYALRTIIQTTRMLVPLVAVIVLGAPFILRLFGENYASEGTVLLRLLCLSAIPDMVVTVYASVVRVQNRIRALFLALSAPYILLVVFSYFFLNIYGVIGVGIAWLTSQSLIAGVLILTELRALLAPNIIQMLFDRK